MLFSERLYFSITIDQDYVELSILKLWFLYLYSNMNSILNTIFTEKLFPFMVLFGVTNRNKLMFFLIFSLTLFKQLMWSLKRFSETPILQSRMPKGISKCYHPINERKLFLPSSVPSNLNFVIVVFKYENKIFSFNIYF